MSSVKIAFIGAGNMAKAIIGGLITEGFIGANIIASGPRQANLETVTAAYPSITTTTDNKIAVTNADVVILAVKPQILKDVAQDLADSLGHKPLIVSLAAGITTASLEKWLGSDHAIVRCMPNTPSQVRTGASGLFANIKVSDTQKDTVTAIMNGVGITQWVEDEHLINSVTAVSGSGPAYFFLMMEAMINAGIEMGLSKASARELTLQTALGAAILAKQSNVDVDELRRRVTSPGGTTEQAIKSFENDQIRAIFARAMQACSNRAVELSEILGD